ncbi:GAF domain-containing protein, partial [Geodermatophilus sp. DF01-2]|uniref:GAF domain-containing protein n=1 Tax=Geodermatophilus sp. DF01-2 TaxID=2559610 RepID=UPI0010730E89
MPVVTRATPPPAERAPVPGQLDGAAEYFALLLEEAAAIEFEGPLVRARAAGADSATLAGLERVKLLALQVRDAFAARRRRESELAALFDTAGDLASLRSVDDVLTAIVRRARQLLGTDVSYLTLNDDGRGDTYMRVTDGSVSARFQALRLPMGAGLGGLVAQTAAPYATARYFADPRFQHTDDINGGVAEEGLVAILGVPLVRGSRVIGVLFAADRNERLFDRSEVSLLGSLAAHAAIALDNARLLEETRTALEELSMATRELRAHSASVERAAGAHDRFIDIVLRGGGVEDVAAAVTEVLGGRITILDEHGRGTPSSGPGADADLPPDPAGALTLARSTGRTVRDGSWWTAAVTVGAELLGGLVLHGDDELSDSDQRILERAALVTALLLLIRRTASEAEGRVRGELLEELLGPALRDPDGLRERARRLGADLDRPHAVVVVLVEERCRGRALAAATHLAAVRGG